MKPLLFILFICCLVFATLTVNAQIIRQSLNGYSPDDTDKMIGPLKGSILRLLK